MRLYTMEPSPLLDVRQIGRTDDGLPIHAWRDQHYGPLRIGLLPEMVEKVKPDAVRDIGGIKTVDYAKALEA